MSVSDFDPHWEWIELGVFGETAPIYIKGACRHLETVAVDLLGGEVVAQLCLTCDARLPPPRDERGAW